MMTDNNDWYYDNTSKATPPNIRNRLLIFANSNNFRVLGSCTVLLHALDSAADVDLRWLFLGNAENQCNYRRANSPSVN